MERVKGVDHKYRLQTKAAWNTLSLRKDCKSGWYKVDETCYFLVKTMRNYDEAKKNCKSKGAKLAEPPSKASWKMMTNFLKETYESTSCCSWYWVGLNDKKKENSFVWTSNGRKVGYNAWYQRGQPNGGRKQNCVGIPKYGKYTWADRVCAYGSPSICEM